MGFADRKRKPARKKAYKEPLPKILIVGGGPHCLDQETQFLRETVNARPARPP